MSGERRNFLTLKGHERARRHRGLSPPDGTRVSHGVTLTGWLVCGICSGDPPAFLALEGMPGTFDKYFDEDAFALRHVPAAFSRDGIHVVTAFDNNTVRVWYLRGERPSFVSLEWNQEGVSSARFNLDGTRVVTLYEASARVWDLGGELLHVVSPMGIRGKSAPWRSTPTERAWSQRRPTERREYGIYGVTNPPLMFSMGIRARSAPRHLAATERGWSRRRTTERRAFGGIGKGSGPALSPSKAIRVRSSLRRSAQTGPMLSPCQETRRRVWCIYPDVNDLIRLVRASLSRCLSQAQREAFGLHTEHPSEDRNFIPPPTPDRHCELIASHLCGFRVDLPEKG